MHPDARRLIDELGLIAHPEGGFYRETFRAETRGGRAASTAIYFLLPSDAFSAWHRVDADEVWHHYAGAPIVLHLLGDDGYARRVVGPAITGGEEPQAVVRAGVWQAAEPLGEFALLGCTVAPAFEFERFELGRREAMIARFPTERAIIERLTR